MTGQLCGATTDHWNGERWVCNVLLDADGTHAGPHADGRWGDGTEWAAWWPTSPLSSAGPTGPDQTHEEGSIMMQYAKGLVAFLFAALALAASAVTDDVITDVEWIEIAIAGLTAGAVWITANAPGYRYAKTAVAAALAGLNFLVGAVIDGMTTADWINFTLAVGAVVFVWAVPNRQPTAVTHQ